MGAGYSTKAGAKKCGIKESYEYLQYNEMIRKCNAFLDSRGLQGGRPMGAALAKTKQREGAR